MSIYKTVARIGRYAPLIIADNMTQAFKLIARFEKTIAAQDDEPCKIGLAGIIASSRAGFDVVWSIDYASNGLDERRAQPSTKAQIEKFDSFYRPKEAKQKQTVRYEV